MAKVLYQMVAFRVDGQDIAWAFVAPQDMPGRASVAANRFDRPGGTVHVDGDLSIGSPEDGTYDIEFNVTVAGGVPGSFQFGEQEYNLTAGRCFAVRPGYRVVQLRAFTPEDGQQLLDEGSDHPVGPREVGKQK